MRLRAFIFVFIIVSLLGTSFGQLTLTGVGAGGAGGGVALAFYPVDVFVISNGSTAGTAVSTVNLANANTTKIAANYTSYDAAMTGMLFAASQVALPARIAVNGDTTYAAGFAGQALSWNFANNFSVSELNFTGLAAQHQVTSNVFMVNLPPFLAGSGNLYDFVVHMGTAFPVTATLQLNKGTSGSCGAYGIEIEYSRPTNTTKHSPCNTSVVPGGTYYFSFFTDWSGTVGCTGIAANTPCAQLNVYQSDGKTQVGSTVAICIKYTTTASTVCQAADTTDFLSRVAFGNNEGASDVGTGYFQWLSVDYSNHVWPNIAH